MLPCLSRRQMFAGVSVFAISICSSISPVLGDPLPTDYTVRHGDITISKNGLNGPQPGMVIDQLGAKGVVDWKTFNIAQNSSVRFKQESTNAITVNRVTGSDPSDILGQLSADGQVVISNPNGVFFGPGAAIDVAGLIATTGRVEIDDFIDDNRITVTDVDQGGGIDIHGQISVSQAGLAAFIAPQIAHHDGALITAQAGHVQLSTGKTATIDFSGGLVEIAVGEHINDSIVELNGNIDAPDGQVILSAATAKRAVDDVIYTDVETATNAVKDGEKIILSAGGSIDMGGGHITADELITLAEKVDVKPDSPLTIKADQWSVVEEDLVIGANLTDAISDLMTEKQEIVCFGRPPCVRHGELIRGRGELVTTPPGLRSLNMIATNDLLLQSGLSFAPGDADSTIRFYAGNRADLSGHPIMTNGADLSAIAPEIALSNQFPEISVTSPADQLLLRADHLPAGLSARADHLIWDRLSPGNVTVEPTDLAKFTPITLQLGQDHINQLAIASDLNGYDQLSFIARGLNIGGHDVITDQLSITADDITLANSAVIAAGDTRIGRNTAGQIIIGPGHWINRLGGTKSTRLHGNIRGIRINDANINLAGQLSFDTAGDLIVTGANDITVDALNLSAGLAMTWTDGAELDTSGVMDLTFSAGGDWNMPSASLLRLGDGNYQFDVAGQWDLAGGNLYRRAGFNFDIGAGHSGLTDMSSAIHAIAPGSGLTTLHLRQNKLTDHGIRIDQGGFVIHGHGGQIIGSDDHDGIIVTGGTVKLNDLGLAGFDTALLYDGGDVTMNGIDFMGNNTAIAMGAGQGDHDITDLGNITIDGLNPKIKRNVRNHFDELLIIEKQVLHAPDDATRSRILFHNPGHWIADPSMNLNTIIGQMGGGDTLNLAGGSGYQADDLVNMPDNVTMIGRKGLAGFSGRHQLNILADDLTLENIAFHNISDGVSFTGQTDLGLYSNRFDHSPVVLSGLHGGLLMDKNTFNTADKETGLTIKDTSASLRISGNAFIGGGNGLELSSVDGTKTAKSWPEMILDNTFTGVNTAVGLNNTINTVIGMNEMTNVSTAVTIADADHSAVIAGGATWTHSGSGVIIEGSGNIRVENLTLAGNGQSTGLEISGEPTDIIELSNINITDQATGVFSTGGTIAVDDSGVRVRDAITGLHFDGDRVGITGNALDSWSFDRIDGNYIQLFNYAFYLYDVPVTLDAKQTMFDGRISDDMNQADYNVLAGRILAYSPRENRQLGKVDIGPGPYVPPPPAPGDDPDDDVIELPEFEEPEIIFVINEDFRLSRKYSAWAEDISSPPVRNTTEITINRDLNMVAPAAGGDTTNKQKASLTCQSGGYTTGGKVTFGPLPICN